MARKVVTLYIDDTSIRLLITDGKSIKERAHSPLEPGLVEGGVVTKEEEVAARIIQLLKDRQVHTKKVNVGLSGLHSLTLVIQLPELPESMLAEAVMREASKVLPVPLEQLYLTWKAIPAATMWMSSASTASSPSNTTPKTSPAASCLLPYL